MSNFKIIKGSCIEQNADVIVNAANKYLMPGGGICGAIFNKAGYDELNDACNKFETPLNDGEVVKTDAFNITNAKYIFHAISPNFSITPNAFDKLYNAYYNSLLLLKENELHSIAFPLISSGINGGLLENPVLESTKQCIDAYNDFINKNDYDIDVTLCAFSDNEYNIAISTQK